MNGARMDRARRAGSEDHAVGSSRLMHDRLNLRVNTRDPGHEQPQPVRLPWRRRRPCAHAGTPSLEAAHRAGARANRSPPRWAAGFAQSTSIVSCPISASSAFTALANFRSCCRCPPLQALRATTCLPSSVLGPVDCSHGRQRLISSACRCRRSMLQPFAIVDLQ